MPNNVKPYRQEKNQTLQALADKVGTSKSYIHEIENGVSVPNIYLGIRIARALKKPVTKVFPIDAIEG